MSRNTIFASSLALAGTALAISTVTPAIAADVTFNFASGNGGFTTSGSPLWTYTGTQWQTNEAFNSTSFLNSPTFTVQSNGNVDISLNHAYNFEDPSDFFDGGVLEASINGGAFSVITPIGGYPNASDTNDGCDGLGFLPCWSGDSGGFVTDTAQLAGLSAGDTFQIRFQAAWDSGTLFSNPNWAISSVSVTNIVSNPPATTPEPGSVVALLGLGALGLAGRKLRR